MRACILRRIKDPQKQVFISRKAYRMRRRDTCCSESFGEWSRRLARRNGKRDTAWATAGALEVVVSITTMQEGLIPPTINYLNLPEFCAKYIYVLRVA